MSRVKKVLAATVLALTLITASSIAAPAAHAGPSNVDPEKYAGLWGICKLAGGSDRYCMTAVLDHL